MSFAVKQKPRSPSLKSRKPLSDGLFAQADEIARDAEIASVPTKLEQAVADMMAAIVEAIDPLEMNVLREIWRQVDEKRASTLVTHRQDHSRTASTPTALATALEEDDAAERFLGQLKDSPDGTPLSTPESVARGRAIVEASQHQAKRAVVDRIESKELLSSGELQKAWKVQRQAISGAVKAQRLFAFTGPSGRKYYPAYFADDIVDRGDIEKVSKMLGSLPAASKDHFFRSEWANLKGTALDALRSGRVREVLEAAANFAERR